MTSHPPPTDDDDYGRNSSSSATASPGYNSDRGSPDGSPYTMSPWHQSDNASPWSYTSDDGTAAATALIGSLVREEGHIYSLAASGDLLYTGSDSKNIHVWKNQKEFSGFKSSSGLVKSIVVSDHRIFTGHQDGKIRVWKVSPKNPAVHKRVGSLPRLKDILKSSLKPSNYVEVRRHKTALWIKHADAISCLSLSTQGLLYSGSWDKTFKVWRIADSRCLESVVAHDDAVNSIAAATFDGLIYTGSADGTVKVWKREMLGKVTKHHPVQTLLKHDCAVTALAVSTAAPVIYAGSSDGIVNFWEGDRQLTHGGVLRGHKMAVLCLAAAGSLLLSGSADKTICVWRRESGGHTCLSVLTGHGGPVKCLAVEVDRSGGENDGGGAAAARWIVYSGSLDKSVKVWRVSDQTPDALLHGPQVGSEDYAGGGQQVGKGLDGRRTSVQAAA